MSNLGATLILNSHTKKYIDFLIVPKKMPIRFVEKTCQFIGYEQLEQEIKVNFCSYS